ncbi:MAG TPA: RNA polymerase sigma factor [Gemmataceae bacterium]|nr:RNA polymerase sigma factor [Gemmataceae bacterium]
MMEPAFLGRLMDQHAAALVLYARQWCTAPEDVVQEAFLKLFAQRQLPDKLLPWLYRVVRNGAVSAARSAQRRRQHETRAAEKTPTWFLASETTGIDCEAATRGLQALSIEQREVIVAHLWGGLTFAQIADLMGSSSSTVHRLYLAGLSALRERLGVTCPRKPMTRN